MTHRTDRIPLANDICRCQPTDCLPQAKKGCARYEAAIPTHGAVLGDFSLKDATGFNLGGTLLCPHRIHVGSLRPPEPVKPAAKPWPT